MIVAQNGLEGLEGLGDLGDFMIPGDPTVYPGCDPLDTACVNTLLRTESGILCPPGTDQSRCYGNAGYDAYVQSQANLYLAQIAGGPQPVYMLPNGQPATSLEQYKLAWSDPSSASIANVTFNQPTVVKQEVQQIVAATTGDKTGGTSSSNLMDFIPSSFSSEITIFGKSFPAWMLGVGALGLYFVGRKI